MSEACSGVHKIRLFIGEGNFSYTEAFIRKHDKKAKHDADNSLAHQIIATELITKINCEMCDLINQYQAQTIGLESASPKILSSCEENSCPVNRIKKLKERGVKVILGVDATSLSTHKKLEGKRFSRIHWNCPHDGSNYVNQTLPPIISQFFRECSKMQKTGDHIHITLAQPSGKRDFYQGYIYDITQGAMRHGYTLIKKRNFDKDRYSGYQHTQTNSNAEASVINDGMYEFVFEKINPEKFKKIINTARDPNSKGIRIKELLEGLAETSKKECTIANKIFYQERRWYYVCSSDEDSSDCEFHEEE